MTVLQTDDERQIQMLWESGNCLSGSRLFLGELNMRSSPLPFIFIQTSLQMILKQSDSYQFTYFSRMTRNCGVQGQSSMNPGFKSIDHHIFNSPVIISAAHSNKERAIVLRTTSDCLSDGWEIIQGHFWRICQDLKSVLQKISTANNLG